MKPEKIPCENCPAWDCGKCPVRMAVIEAAYSLGPRTPAGRQLMNKKEVENDD